jgi:D-glycero-beta-D-manno-heptose 1-phosphate adenylyltransferase
MSSGASSPRTSRLLDRAELARHLERLRHEEPATRVVLANGCFEILHVGHLRYLCDARSRGDRLVVALNSDLSVRALKGEGRPLVPFEERAELLLGLECVDWVTGFEELTLEQTLRILRPAVHAKGTDYTADTVPERWVDDELEIEIAICGDPKTHSSSSLARHLAARSPDLLSRR